MHFFLSFFFFFDVEYLVIRHVFKTFCTILNLRKNNWANYVIFLDSNFKRQQNSNIITYANGNKIKIIKNPNNFQKRIQYWFPFKSELIPLKEILEMWRKSKFWSQRTYMNFSTLMHLKWNGMMKLLNYINPQKYLRNIKKKINLTTTSFDYDLTSVSYFHSFICSYS